MSAYTEPLTVQEVLQLANGVQGNGSGYIACCPVHEADDLPHNPSLHIWSGRGATAGLKCVSQGCAYADILRSLRGGHRVATFRYDDGTDNIVAEVDRWEFPSENGKPDKDFPPYLVVNGERAKKAGLGGQRLPLYHRREVLAVAARGDTIYIVEGEGKADRLNEALRSAGVSGVAMTLGGGAKAALTPQMAEDFRGAGRVVVLGDNDVPGHKAARKRGAAALGVVSDVRVVETMPDVRAKGDIADWLANGGTVAELRALVEATPIFVPTQADSGTEREASEGNGGREYSDVDNAHFLIEQHYADLRYVDEECEWRRYDGGRWRPCTKVEVRELGQQLLLAERDELHALADLRASLRLQQKQLRAFNRVDSMVTAAQAMCRVSVAAFDRDPALLNCANGTLDLRTYELHEHDPKETFTKIAPVAYRADAPTPENFLATLRAATGSDDELVAYVQCLFGWTLEGDVGTRRLWLVYGPANTGKTTIFGKVLCALLGDDYARVINVLALAERKQNAGAPNNEVYMLRGARYIVASETSSAKLSATTIKRLTGGDPITVRANYKMPVTFTPEGKIVIYGNEKPELPDADDATWERVKPVPFAQQAYSGKKDLRYFENALRPELEGILAWAVEGHRRLRAMDYNLEDPAVVKAAIEEYREEENRIRDFLDECCETRTPTDFVPSAELREAYSWYCWQKHIKYPLGERAFANAVKNAGYEAGREGTHANRRGFSGLRLKAETIQKIALTSASARRSRECDDSQY